MLQSASGIRGRRIDFPGGFQRFGYDRQKIRGGCQLLCSMTTIPERSSITPPTGNSPTLSASAFPALGRVCHRWPSAAAHYSSLHGPDAPPRPRGAAYKVRNPLPPISRGPDLFNCQLLLRPPKKNLRARPANASFARGRKLTVDRLHRHRLDRLTGEIGWSRASVVSSTHRSQKGARYDWRGPHRSRRAGHEAPYHSGLCWCRYSSRHRSDRSQPTRWN